MSQIQRFIIAILGLTFISSVLAAPVQLTETQFTDQTTGFPTIVETFEGFPLGPQTSPFTIANGTYTGSPSIFFDAWCFVSQCMNSNIADGTFDGLPTGTTFWGVKILPASSGDVLQVTVTGNSGVLQIEIPEEGEMFFLGFSDPTGLNSIDFHLVQGFTNYAFDDVTTTASEIIFTNGFED